MIDKEIINKCKCPILAGNIIFNSMMLLDDASYTNPRVNIDVLKMQLDLYLRGFDKNCKKVERRMPIAEMRKRIDMIKSTEIISEQEKEILMGIDAANDMAMDSISPKDPIDLL